MIIEIDTERLNVDITDMREHLEELDRAQQQIYRCLENLKAMWQGPAQMRFYAQTQIDQATLRGLMGNLENLVQCMEYAKNEYNRCSNEVQEKIAAIRLAGVR